MHISEKKEGKDLPIITCISKNPKNITEITSHGDHCCCLVIILLSIRSFVKKDIDWFENNMGLVWFLYILPWFINNNNSFCFFLDHPTLIIKSNCFLPLSWPTIDIGIKDDLDGRKWINVTTWFDFLLSYACRETYQSNKSNHQEEY